jgi:regulator of sigma E protease
MVYESLYDLLTGRYTFGAVSGPVGVSETIGEAARSGFSTVLYITALISINLGVMNLLPLPALDGGRTLTTLVEIITRKRMPKKLEATINAVGLILLLALSAVILVKDVIQLII